MIDNNGQNLGYILSTPRSGSTLLSSILDGHKSIHVPNEPWILLGLSKLYPNEETHKHTIYQDNQQYAAQAIRRFLTPEQFCEASRQFALAAYNSVLETKKKTILIDKTPRYFHVIPMLKELFPAAKKIWLKRNPLDIAASYLSTWSITPEMLTGTPLLPVSFDLTFGLPSIAEFASTSSNFIEIKYEDLVSDTEQAVQKVCAHLDVSYDKEMLEYTKSEAIASNTQHSLGDKKILKHHRPHSQSVNTWVSVLDSAQVQLIVDYLGEEIFVRMGYQDTIAQLKIMGYKIPSQDSVSTRRSEILEKESTLQSYFASKGGLYALGRETCASLEELRASYKRLQNKKWVRFGRAIRACKFKPIEATD
jgi:hypothetical protein